MKSSRASWRCLALAVLSCVTTSANALPLITSLTEHGTGLNANAAIVTSSTSRLPQPEGAGTSGALVDEAYAYVTRNAEWTAPRTEGNALATGGTTIHPFPSYLTGLEYVQITMENRIVPDYSIDVTLSGPAKAYLFIDNRSNGTTGMNNSSNLTDPDLGGVLSWVVSDGWTRVNTGFMPDNRPDYLGVDEGGTVANAAARTHANPAGSGQSVDRFSALFSKDFAGGTHIGFTKTFGINNANMYGIALASSGPPPLTGDTDGDGVIELEDDFGPIRDNFRKSGKTRAQGDLTGGGVVDFNDFRQWKTAFVGAGGSLDSVDFSFTSVPEPGSCVLALLALVTLAKVRGGRLQCAI